MCILFSSYAGKYCIQRLMSECCSSASVTRVCLCPCADDASQPTCQDTVCAIQHNLAFAFLPMASSSGAHRVHSWEKASRSWGQSALVGSDSEDDDDPASAGEALVDFLCELKFSGKLSAQSVCLLAHWAAKAGACGLVSKLGKPAGAPTGTYSAHFDKVIGHRSVEQDLYWMDVPGYRKYDGIRVSLAIPVFPPS